MMKPRHSPFWKQSVSLSDEILQEARASSSGCSSSLCKDLAAVRIPGLALIRQQRHVTPELRQHELQRQSMIFLKSISFWSPANFHFPACFCFSGFVLTASRRVCSKKNSIRQKQLLLQQEWSWHVLLLHVGQSMNMLHRWSCDSASVCGHGPLLVK